MQAIFAGLFEKNAAGEGKLRWGDKTPYYVLHMPMLLGRFPGAQFIHLIRDGRDVALSLFDRRHDRIIDQYRAVKLFTRMNNPVPDGGPAGPGSSTSASNRGFGLDSRLPVACNSIARMVLLLYPASAKVYGAPSKGWQ